MDRLNDQVIGDILKKELDVFLFENACANLVFLSKMESKYFKEAKKYEHWIIPMQE